MTPEQFAYWLQGYFEMSETRTLSQRQVQVVKDHLAQVFDKRTPDRPAYTFYPDPPLHMLDGATICDAKDKPLFHSDSPLAPGTIC